MEDKKKPNWFNEKQQKRAEEMEKGLKKEPYLFTKMKEFLGKKPKKEDEEEEEDK